MNIPKRILTLLLSTFFFLSAHSQSATVNISRTTVRKAIVMFKKQTGYSLVFPYGAIDLDKQVSIQAEHASINTIMNQLLAGQADLSYIIQGKMILISQTEKVRPRRTSATKKLPESSPPIPVIQDLDEVVVIGYTSIRKSDLTGAVTSVDMDHVIPFADNTESMLQGTVPGVYVSKGNGAPGALPFLYIRGLATVNNQCTPLYVVDGVQVGTDISFLNPQDIAHIEILRDASATAIYGAQAANGVVLITMKTGCAGSLHVEACAQMDLAWNSTRFPMLSADHYAEAIRQARANDGNVLMMPVWEEQYDRQRITTNWQDVMSQISLVRNARVSASGGTDHLQGMASLSLRQQPGIIATTYLNRTDFHAHVTGQTPRLALQGAVNASHTEHALSSGNIITYAAMPATMDYTDDSGRIVHPSVVNPDGTYGTFWQYSGKSELSSSIDNLYARRKENNLSTANNYVFSYIEADLQLLHSLHLKTNASLLMQQTDENVYYATRRRYNPQFSDADQQFQLAEVSLANSTTSNSLTFTKSNLYRRALESFLTYSHNSQRTSLTALAGLTMLSTDANYNIASAGSFVFENIRNLSLSIDRSTNSAAGAFQTDSRLLSFYARSIFSIDHRYSLTASLRRDGSSHFHADNRWGTFPSFAASWRLSEEKALSPISWLDDLKLRLGWGVTGNSGLPNELNIPQLTSENVQYKFYGKDSPSGQAISHTGYSLSDIVDENLRWERNSQVNIGIDALLLGQHLSLSADYYVRTTSNLLLSQPLRLSTGFQSIYTNSGRIRNSGLEMLLRYRHTFATTTLNIQTNITTLHNRVIDCPSPIFFNYNSNQGMHWQKISTCQQGYPLGAWYAYRTDGLFRSQTDIDQADAYAQSLGKSHYQPHAQPGDIRFIDVNGDGTISEEDMTVIGNGYARCTLGSTIALRHRNIDFQANIHAELGRKILSYSAMTMTLMTSSDSYVPNILQSAYLNAWSPANPDGIYPRLSINDANWNMRCSDFWVRNGNYLKISNLQIGYSLPARTAKALRLSNARLYANLSNVLTLSPYSKYGNPELDGSIVFQGIDDGNYPVAKTISLGIQLKF